MKGKPSGLKTRATADVCKRLGELKNERTPIVTRPAARVSFCFGILRPQEARPHRITGRRADRFGHASVRRGRFHAKSRAGAARCALAKTRSRVSGLDA